MKITYTYDTQLDADRLHPADEMFLRAHCDDTDPDGNRLFPEHMHLGELLAEIDRLREQVETHGKRTKTRKEV